MKDQGSSKIRCARLCFKKRVLICAAAGLLQLFPGSRAVASLPPPQGKSLKKESDYTADAKDLSWYDLAGRIDQRGRSIREGQTVSAGAVTQDATMSAGSTGSAGTEVTGAPLENSALKSKSSPRVKRMSLGDGAPGNLPAFYKNIDRSEFKASDKVVYVPQNSVVKLSSVKAGDLFYAVIDQRIKASPGVPTPLRAMVTSGALKGGFFLGEGTLDLELKRILFSFTRVRSREGKTYGVKAAGLSPEGSVGLEGEYHSQAGTFFLAELASAATAGFLDSTISRNQTAAGGYVQEPSLSNSAKTGAVTALSKSAERMADRAKQAPEYTVAEGYQAIQIIVQEDPTETN